MSEASTRAVAEVVADVKPDVAFVLWPRDQHPDHEAASAICRAALRLGDRVLADPFAAYAAPRRIYQYDNGPRHTIRFVPNTFVDVTTEFPRSLEWLGRLMALVRDEPYAPGPLDSAQRLRETLLRYRGATCGVAYAEALRSIDAYPQAILAESLTTQPPVGPLARTRKHRLVLSGSTRTAYFLTKPADRNAPGHVLRAAKPPSPGSNPGGASKFPVQIRRTVLPQHKPAPRNWTTLDYKS